MSVRTSRSRPVSAASGAADSVGRTRSAYRPMSWRGTAGAGSGPPPRRLAHARHVRLRVEDRHVTRAHERLVLADHHADHDAPSPALPDVPPMATSGPSFLLPGPARKSHSCAQPPRAPLMTPPR